MTIILGQGRGRNRNGGGTIRTISVSLLAAAAVALGIVVSRTRQARTADEVPTIENDDITEGGISLEALRAAGI